MNLSDEHKEYMKAIEALNEKGKAIRDEVAEYAPKRWKDYLEEIRTNQKVREDAFNDAKVYNAFIKGNVNRRYPGEHTASELDKIGSTDFIELTEEDGEKHPLYEVLMAAITQATKGKGQRHGGNTIPFMEQPWLHYAKLHGRGFLTGQAAKKLEEAASTRKGVAFETEVLGAIVFCGMALLFERMEENG